MRNWVVTVLCVMVALLVVGGLGPESVLAQGQPGEAATSTTPRTPWDDPDLGGMWDFRTLTPLQRPAQMAGKGFLTDEEAAAFVQQTLQARDKDRRYDNPQIDVEFAYNQFWWDYGTTITDDKRTSLIVDPPDGRLPSMNEAGERQATARNAAQARLGGRWDSAEANQLDDRCIIMRGVGPPMMNSGYNSNYHIVQGPGQVMILSEMIHDARVIPLEGFTSPATGVSQWVGLSRGRWEGETLVVETTNFNGKNPFYGSGHQMAVTERFTRTADDIIMYRFTVDDPATWDRPWTAELPMQKTRGPLFEFACHEGNYGLYNTLVGARLEEQEAASAAGQTK